jgi:hypothetical protein
VSVPKSAFSHFEVKQVSIHVVGAASECTLLVPSGASVDDILQQISLLPEADLLEIDGSRKIVSDITLVVPFIDVLTLYVTGAVRQPQVLLFPSPTSASAILQKIQLSENADRSRFMRRKVFRTGMVVVVPEKKVRSKG